MTTGRGRAGLAVGAAMCAAALSALTPRGYDALGAQGPSPVVAVMLGHEVAWHAQPTTTVRIDLLEGAAVLASAVGQTDAAGWLTTTLGAGDDSLVRPGRLIRAGLDGAAPTASATVPDFSTQLLHDERELGGRAPAGKLVTAWITARDLVTTAVTTAAADGMYAVALPAGFGPNEGATGFVSVREGDGEFRATFEGLSALAELGSPLVTGRATRGGTVQAIVRSPTEASSEPLAVEDQPAFQLTLKKGNAEHAVNPGDRLAIVENGHDVLSTIVPSLTVTGDLTGEVRGSSAPRSQVRIEADGPGGHAYAITAAAVDGEYHAYLGDQMLFLPGTRLTVTTGQRLRIKHDITLLGTLARLNSPTVSGVVTPDLDIIVTVLDRRGRPKGNGTGMTDSAGRFAVTLLDRQDRPVAMTGEDAIVVGLGSDLPVRTPLLPLQGYASPADDVVVGSTAPGMEVVVEGNGVTRRQAADSQGVFVADFGAEFGAALDVSAGYVGRLYAVLPTLVVQSDWVAPLVDAALQEAALSGVSAPGLPVTATLNAGATNPIAGGLFEANSAGAFAMDLRASDAHPVPVMPFDTVGIAAPGYEGRVELPELSLTASPVSGRVFGVAPAGALVSVTRGGGAETTARADAAGRFEATLDQMPAAGATLNVETLLSDLVRLRAFEAVHRVMAYFDTGELAGWAAPDAHVSASLLESGAQVAEATGTADDAGRYRLQLVDDSGSPVRIRDGARLLISDGTVSPVDTTAPALALAVDSGAGSIGVQGPPNTTIRSIFRAHRGLRAGRATAAVAQLGSSGQGSVAFPDGFEAADGIVADVELDRGGVTWVRAAGVSYIEVQAGGALVRGRELPGRLLTVAARRGGSPLGSALVRADWRGLYSALLDLPESTVLNTGDLVAVQGGAGTTVQPLTVELDVALGAAGGSAPPGARVDIALEGWDGHPAGQADAVAGSNGSFLSPVPQPAPLAPGLSGQAAVRDQAGMGTVALDTAPRITARIGSSMVRGVGTPFGRSDLSAAGAVEAEGVATGDTFGRWEVELRRAGQPTAVIAGTILSLTPHGSAPITIAVPDLGIGQFDKGIVTGWAPPSAVVHTTISGPGPTFDAAVRAGLDGTWVVRASELPGPPPFPLSQTSSVTAWIDVDGHRVEAVTVSGAPTSTPSPTASATPRPGASPTSTRTPPVSSTATRTPNTGTGTPSATPTSGTPTPQGASLFLPYVRQRQSR